MTAMRPLDVATLPLEGAVLMEASAGTGKTWTLAALFLRLVLEKGLPVHGILVVTFTEAATQELRRRLRDRLRVALTAFRTGLPPSGDPVMTRLLSSLDRVQAIARLEAAIRDFDQAAIHTIHAFCMRVLRELAFETGQTFRSDMGGSDEAHLRQAALDFWRRKIVPLPPLLQTVLLKNLTPDTLSGLGGTYLNHPDAALIPEHPLPSQADLERPVTPFLEAFRRVADLWADQAEAAAEALIRGADGLNQKSYKTDNLHEYINKLGLYVQSAPDPAVPKEVQKLAASRLAEGTKKNCTTPSHPVFEALDAVLATGAALDETATGLALGLRLAFLSGLRQELETRKKVRNTLTFNDLILRTHQAFLSPRGEEVTRTLRQRFQAALIDEFQDTDPAQYAVFSALFHHPEHFLCLVGDPKQAIYSFRGADLHAYIRARTDMAGLYGLGTNHRSDEGVVEAVNTLFAAHPRPFQLAELAFHKVAPKHPDRLILDGHPASGLHIWHMERTPGDALTRNGQHPADPAKAMAVRAVAAEISSLLEAAEKGAASISENGSLRPLEPGDMAVLVFSRTQAQLMYDALATLRIPCVLQRIENIFDSREARETLRILEAVRNPSNERLLRAALATDILGWDASRIHALDTDEEARVERLDRCAAWREAWIGQGVMAMFRGLMRESGVQARLLGKPRGERRMTNLLHLVELLHDQEHSRGLAPEDLSAWLAQSVNTESERLDEYNQRLESDERAVKILTMHKSKGLEFNIVFCPFLYKQGGMPNPADIYHAPGDGSLCFDLGGTDEAKIRAEAEKHAETLRLLYVALTRARHRCYLTWGAVYQGDTSAPAWLLHARAEAQGPEAMTRVRGLLGGLSDQAIRDRLLELNRLCPTLTFGPLPRTDGLAYTSSSPLSGPPLIQPYARRLDRSWRITSYTALAGAQGGRHRQGDEVDAASPLPGSLPTPAPAKKRPTLPLGPAVGIMLHQVLEQADLSQVTRNSTETLAAQVLARQGLDTALSGEVADLVLLAAERELLPALRLRDVSWADRSAEFGFHLPLGRMNRAALTAVYTRHAAVLPPGFTRAASELDFLPCSGFLTGSMDLVFRKDSRHYLLDWKSNYLGDAEESYGPEALTRAMASARYFLQYHLYCLALDRHLARCVPDYSRDRHFGGVFYVFLRGLAIEKPGHAVFHERPADAFLDDLSVTLLAPGGV